MSEIFKKVIEIIINIKKTKIAKSVEKTLTKVDNLYKSIIKAGTYKVSSIKIAVCAKLCNNKSNLSLKASKFSKGP